MTQCGGSALASLLLSTCSADHGTGPAPVAVRLAFQVSPGSSTAGTSFAPAVKVVALDAAGTSVASFADSITLTIENNPGNGTLAGATKRAAVAGVATFADLSLNRPGKGYRLSASSGNLTAATSASFDVAAGPATQLRFTAQPASTSGGAVMSSAIQVTALDALENTADGFTGNVTLTITSGTGAAGAALSGTQTMAAVGGVATFTSLSIDKASTGYTLTATASGLIKATSASFDITLGPPARLAFTVPPVTSTAGDTITPAIVVTAQDAGGNPTATFTGDVTVGIGTNPAAGTLSGTTTVTAAAGVATFATLSINRSGGGYTLTAAATGMTGATSVPFTVAPGAATQLVFSVEPTNGTAGAAIAPAVQVTAQDALGNRATGFSSAIALAIEANPGGGTLTGTTTVTAAAGVAAFPTLSIDKTGSGYTVTATSAGLTSATSAPFDVGPGAATRLVVTAQPTGGTGGASITPAVQVTVQDALGNRAVGFTGDVTASIGTNPAGGTLSGTTTTAAVAGVATFPNLGIDRAGTGYTLAFATTGLTGATSAPFDVTVGPASRLAFTVPPVTTTAGAAITPAIVVTAQDAGGNTATSFTADVTVGIGTSPAAGTLSGTTTVAAVGGMATFSTLSIDKAGGGYTLTAQAAGVVAATSAPFTITPGAATQLAFSIQPTNTAGGAIIAAAEITARDALGNTATAFNGDVTVAIGTNLAGGTLSGTTTVAAVAGVAAFSTLSIDKAGNGYTLVATATGLSGATSAPFNVTVGAASRLAFTVPPVTTTAGATITPAIAVTALDAGGNTVTGFTADVTVAIATNPAAGTLSGTTTVAAVAGVATFSTLSINRSGSGYTLVASAGGVTGAGSSAFTITPGPATQLDLTVQPTSTTAGAAMTPSVEVTARDALGNLAAGFTGHVTVAIQTNPASGTLSGTTTATAVAGVATFPGLSIDKTGSGYTLIATAPGVTEIVSVPFAITPGPATQLAFSVQPAATAAGSVMSPAVQVTAQDALGNTASGFTGNVTVAIGANIAGGTLSGTTTVAAAAGVATFATLSINKSGSGYTLLATAAGTTGATSASFAITAAVATQLAFNVQPGATIAGVTIAPAVQVVARDGLGNTATGFTGSVTVAIGTNPGSGALSGTTTVAAVGGVATFSTLSINKAGAGYTLSAVAAGLTGATSGSFTVSPGAATHLVFSGQPGNATAGTVIAPSVQVTALDGFDNIATGFASAVTVTIEANPAAGTLSGTTTVAPIAGVATFSDLSIDKSGSGYSLLGAATGVTSATSAAFNVAAGAATQLVITVQPTNTTGGVVMTPAVRVTARDAFGNTAVGFTSDVTATIGTNPAGGTLSGTTTVAAVAGVATFSTLSLDKVGTGYTLAFATPGLNGATSAPFDVGVGAASRLVFSVPPVTTTAGATMTPAIVVSAQDAGGNTVTGFTANVTVAIGTNPAAATLSGTTTVAAVAGVATFSSLSINKSGSGYTLSATSSGLSTATSGSFTINPGAATHLTVTTQPTNTMAGASITPALQVTAQDALGNTATSFSGDVTAAIGTNPSGGTLSGATTVAAVAGVAQFTDLSIDKAGSGYTISVTASGVTGTTSGAFAILVGAANRLVFAAQPVTTTAGATITPAVQVSAQDVGGNVVTTFTGVVTLAITPGTGSSGATLSGTTSVAAVAGVATFSTLSISKSGTGYTLSASALGLSSAASAAFDINTGSAARLRFSVQPVSTTAGATIAPPIQVSAEDAVGNMVTSFTGDVTMTIGTNPAGGTLLGTTTVAAVAGVASFSTLSIDKSATGYTLHASATGLAAATSSSFTVNPGAATQLAFTTQPSTSSAGGFITPGVEVTARDGFGNTATGFTGNVTIAIGTNPGGGVLSGTTTAAAVAGIATFSTLSIDQAGSGYTLTAVAGGLPGATSTPFDVTNTTLVFTVQPTTTTAGAKITPAVQVTARNSLGQTITTFTGQVKVAIVPGTGTAGATLSGTTTVSAVSGVASFSTLSIDKAGTGYRLSAAATGFPSATSGTFTVNVGAATKLGFLVPPSTTPAGATIIPAVQVAAQDALGNTVKSFTGTVTMAISTNPSSGILSGTTTVTLNAGVAAFSTLSINKAGVGYRLRATTTGLTNATSAPFDITPAAATQLIFTVQPITTTAGDVITPAVAVTAEDSMGNVVTGFSGDVTVLITAGSGTAGATLTGTTTVTAVGGVAIFSDLRIDKAGTGYKLSATASGVAGKNSASFQIVAGTPVRVNFSVQPVTTTAGAIITPAVQVDVRDSLNNVVKTFTGDITIAIGVNPGGGTLSGTTTLAAVAGVAVFSDLSIDLAATGYRLVATAAGLNAATSAAFSITP